MKMIIYFVLIVNICCTFSFCDNGKTINKGRLIEAPINYGLCGAISNLVGFKFKELNSNNQYILLIPCPEAYNKGFFTKNQIYCFDTTSDKQSYKEYIIINKFENEKLTTYYISSIRKDK